MLYVAGEILIPPHQPAADLSSLLVLEPHAHEERVVADQDPDLRALGGRLALLGIPLRELVHRLGLGPDGLVQLPIHLDSLAGLERPDLLIEELLLGEVGVYFFQD